MFKPGTPKPAKSGRKVGTPNKKTVAVIEMVQRSGKDPIEVLADLMSHDEPSIRLAAAKELAQYIYPKRKPLEGDPSAPTPPPQLTPEQFAIYVDRMIAARVKA